MTLGYEMQFIECPNISALAWDGDELVEPCSGRRFSPHQSPSQRAFFCGYPFDRGLCIRERDDFWTVAYENLGTKAVLYRNWKLHRELNRSYYFAKDFDYPVALAAISGGRVVIIHCPNSYDTIEVEDAETGEILGKKKSDKMEFHSRLSVSSDGNFLLSRGWFWHPVGGAWLCPLSSIFLSEGAREEEIGFSFGAEIDDAAFIGNDHIVVSSTEEVVNDEAPPSGLEPLQLGMWSVAESKWTSVAALQETTGTLMPWREWAISFYEHPKAIELSTGEVVHVWDQLDSGKQIGSIQIGEPPPPVMALNPESGMFAVCDSTGITVVSLHVSG